MNKINISSLVHVVQNRPIKISSATYIRRKLPKSEWKICSSCNGTGTYLMEGDLHKSSGYVPCNCSGGMLTYELVQVKKPVYRIKSGRRVISNG